MVRQRHDLGESFARLLRAVIALEQPVLEQHGLVMWDYVVLTALGQADAPAQAALADLVGRDTTRLIPILDRLEARSAVRRDVDPADRRNRIVRLTDPGRQLLVACQQDIRSAEAVLLSDIDPGERHIFIRLLDTLAEQHNRSRK